MRLLFFIQLLTSGYTSDIIYTKIAMEVDRMQPEGMIKDGLRTIREIGGSFNISLPKQFLKTVGLDKGDFVELMFNSEMLVVLPGPKKSERDGNADKPVNPES